MKRVGIEVAVAAGLAVVFPLYKIFTLPEICDSPKLTPGEAAALLAALASYLSVPLLFGLLRGQRAARYVWLWTPVMGSMLTAVALYRLVVLKDWGPAQFATVWLALCVWTLPFAAAVHYSGMIVRGIRRRHEGPNEELSISPR
jgi:peptidoglycan biosynthesis protein MviN/MurJ (putative lipid II flippase)